MQQFTIKDIENLCNIKAHTIRIWEQRYKLIIPERKKSLRRIYDNDDLKHLLRIAFLYHNGWKISRIAALNADEITNEVYKSEINSVTYKNYIIKLIVAAIDFNEPQFHQLLDELIEKIGFEKCITDICYPYLQRVGLLWVTSNIIPAQEHFSSYIIMHKIIAEADKLPTINTGGKIILFSPQGEHHELPLLFVHYLLKKNGWSVIYLGSNVSKDLLKQVTHKEDVSYLFLHMITNFTGWEADLFFEDLCRSFQNKTIVATGTVTHQMQRSFTNLKLLKNDKAVYDFINQDH